MTDTLDADAADTAVDGVVLTGQITRADHETYKELGFAVPPGRQTLLSREYPPPSWISD